MKPVLFLSFTVAWLVIACGPAVSAGMEFSPSRREVAVLEGALQLPAGADPLAKYVRFYAGKLDGGRHTIVGVLESGSNKSGIQIVDLAHLPHVVDGGCSIIHVKYDVESRTFKEVACNGVA